MKKILIILITGILSFHLAAQTEKPDSVMGHIADLLLEVSEMGNSFNDSILKKYENDLRKISFVDLSYSYEKGTLDSRDCLPESFITNWGFALNSINKQNSPLITTESKTTDSPPISASFSPIRNKNRLSIYTLRVRIKKGESFKTSFREQGRFQLLAVAEKGGLVTTKLHAHDSRSGYDKHFDDTDNFHQGKNVRNTAISLPDKYVDIDVEIINRADHNITCVLVFK